MAHTFSITDTSTTISLTSDGIIVTRYDMQSPDMAESEFSTGSDGTELTRPQWRNVTESIDILIGGTTPQEVRDKGNALELMLNRARDSRRVMTRQRIYVQAQIAAESDTWRSEILSARFVWRDALHGVMRLQAEATIILTRRYYWEGPEVQLALRSNANGTATTSPVSLTNNNANNWFEVNLAESAKAGLLPSPMRLHLTNNEAGNVNTRNIYLANYTFWGTSTPIRTAFNMGGANYSTGSSANQIAYAGELPAGLLSNIDGRFARILASFSSDMDGYIQAGLYELSSGLVHYRNEQVRGRGFDEAVIDVGAMPIPLAGGLASPGNLGLNLWIQKAGGISATLVIVQLTPTGDGLFRRILSGGLGGGHTLIDDGITDRLYQTDGTVEITAVTGYHQPLHIWPGRTNRMRMLYHTSTGLGTGNSVTVQAWIRPRRLTV